MRWMPGFSPARGPDGPAECPTGCLQAAPRRPNDPVIGAQDGAPVITR
jgi:hypothetical protein